ncbi:MAG: hypothetical protein FWH03_05695 [Firmicutes bacterium]|nr:hypothetical protein [Bacillota bacterium]
MKKRIALLIICVLFVSIFTGCLPQETEQTDDELEHPVQVTIIFMVDGEAYTTVTAEIERIKMPASPTFDDAVFEGWFYDDGIWEKPFTLSTLSDAPLLETFTVYAKIVQAAKPENTAFTTGRYLRDDGYIFIEFFEDNQFFVGSDYFVFWWSPNGIYEIENNILTLYLTDWFFDNEEYAVFDVMDDYLVCKSVNYNNMGNFFESGDIFRLEHLNPEVKTTIQQSYIDTYLQHISRGVVQEEIRVDYYGTYGEFVAVMISFNDFMDAAMRTETVADYDFYYPGIGGPFEFYICVWNNGVFYTLTDAYAQKLLSIFDIRLIHAFHTGFNINTWYQIKPDYQKQYGYPMYFDKYLGKHNGFETFFIAGFDAAIWEVEVAEYSFWASTQSQIVLYKNGAFLNFIDAYNQGFLSAQDIANIWDNYTGN